MLDCYYNGYLGTLYDIHSQGIHLIFPIEQEQVLKSLTIDTKLSKSLYERLGEDITKLKDKVRVTVSRGIATNMSFEKIAMNIDLQSRIGINNAFRIARTEGHRFNAKLHIMSKTKLKKKK